MTAPTVGQLLVAFLNVSQYPSARTATAPDGTWTQLEDASHGYDRLYIFWKVADGSEGTSIVFSITSAENHAGVLVVLDGATGMGAHSSNTASNTTPSVTDTPGSGLPLAVWINDNAATSTYSGGYTLVREQAGAGATSGFHQCTVAQGPVGGAGSSASSTITWSGGSTEAAGLVLVTGNPLAAPYRRGAQTRRQAVLQASSR